MLSKICFILDSWVVISLALIPFCILCLSLPSQALDGDFSEENRNRCRVATAPLIEAVENLTTFASNPEFASVPAQISSEVLYDHVKHVFMCAHITCRHLHSG